MIIYIFKWEKRRYKKLLSKVKQKTIRAMMNLNHNQTNQRSPQNPKLLNQTLCRLIKKKEGKVNRLKRKRRVQKRKLNKYNYLQKGSIKELKSSKDFINNTYN